MICNCKRIWAQAVRASIICMMLFVGLSDGEAHGGPFIEGELILELQNDYGFKSDDPDNRLNDTFGYGELASVMHISPFVDLNSVFVFEPVLDPVNPGRSRFFEGHGLYAEVLSFQINLGGKTSIIAGKYGPGFGTAWDVTPGIYGVDFAEDYELAEQLGFAVAHNFGGQHIGSFVLGGHIFTADTSFLSNSVFAERGRTRKSAGGAGNTGNLDNFSISLDVGNIKGVDGVSLHLAYRHLSKGLDSTHNENGYVAGFVYETKVSEEVSLTLNGEVVHLNHQGGGVDDQNFYIAGVSFGYGQWHFDLAGTQRNTDVAAGVDVKDELFQASLGYTDSHDVDWNVGYKFTEEGTVDTHFLGFFITKTFGFEG